MLIFVLRTLLYNAANFFWSSLPKILELHLRHIAGRGLTPKIVQKLIKLPGISESVESEAVESEAAEPFQLGQCSYKLCLGKDLFLATPLLIPKTLDQCNHFNKKKSFYIKNCSASKISVMKSIKYLKLLNGCTPQILCSKCLLL